MKPNLSDNDLIFENYSKTKKVIKEDFSNEKKEVQIGQEILKCCEGLERRFGFAIKTTSPDFIKIKHLADDLIALHSGETVVQPGTGGALVKSGSVL